MLRRGVATVFLVALVASGCSGLNLPQATSHSKDPTNIAPCSAMQDLLGTTTPNWSTEQRDYVIRLMAASAQRADDVHLRSAGVGLSRALAANNLPDRGTYLGQMASTCTQIGLLKLQ